MQQDPPIEFVEFFRLGTSNSKNNNPEFRLSKQAMLGEFHNAIYVNYAQSMVSNMSYLVGGWCMARRS